MQQSSLTNNFTTTLNKKTTKNDSSKENPNDNLYDSSKISREIYDILSDGNNYDLAIKLDGTSALISLDSTTKEPSIVPLGENDSFNDIITMADRYINFDTTDEYSINDLTQLKDKISTSSISEKYKLVKDILNNTDTNLKEIDLIDIYFKYIAQK